MEIKNKLKKALIGGLSGLAVALSSGANETRASPLLNPMEVSTVPTGSRSNFPNSVYCLRGKDYSVGIYADSTMNPSQTIISSRWDVVVPPSVTVTGVRLPSLDNPNTTNPADFFYGSFLMGNYLETSVVGGELSLNARASDDGTSGTMNKKGLLEIIDFRVKDNAPLGYSRFNLNDVYFLDSDLNVYDSPAGVSPAITTKMIIVKPGDANIDGRSDVGDLGILAANYGQTNITWWEADFTGDGVVDVGDLGVLAANYELPIQGSSVPEPSSFVLFGLSALGTGLFKRRKN